MLHRKRMLAPLSLLLLLMSVSPIAVGQSAYDLYEEGKEYRDKGRNMKAVKKFEEALEEAEASHNRRLQMNIHIELAELKDNVINYKEALDHYKAFSELYKEQMTAINEELSESNEVLTESVDSLDSEVKESQEEIQQKNTELENKEETIATMSKKQLQTELEKEKHKREAQEERNRINVLAAVIGLVIIVLIFFSLGYARKRKTNKTLRNKNYQIAKEKEKSEELLLNILPKAVAEELKEFGRTSTRSFENATIMFTDFKGFTKFSEKHDPQEIVDIIDGYFRAFDEIVEKYQIEKIKTIGDAYMCVSGIPEPIEDHAKIMIRAAQEMKALVDEKMKSLKDEGKSYLEMRIGIHSGPLVAGVVGSRKFAYDVWGDAVNIAARMEQSGIPGSINVSENVYALTKDEFDFEYRGEVEAKNKGMMKMYFVKD